MGYIRHVALAIGLDWIVFGGIVGIGNEISIIRKPASFKTALLY